MPRRACVARKTQSESRTPSGAMFIITEARSGYGHGFAKQFGSEYDLDNHHYLNFHFLNFHFLNFKLYTF